MINQVWLDCNYVLEIKYYNVMNTRDYNSRLRKKNQIGTWLNKYLKLF
jgi:hypothetical protein